MNSIKNSIYNLFSHDNEQKQTLRNMCVAAIARTYDDKPRDLYMEREDGKGYAAMFRSKEDFMLVRVPDKTAPMLQFFVERALITD